MGQSPSAEFTFESIHDEFKRKFRDVTELASLSLDELQFYIKDINTLSSKCMDAEGNQLKFEIDDESQNGLFWKTTVQILCFKVNSDSNTCEQQRSMSLIQFLKVYKSIKAQFRTAELVGNGQDEQGACGGSSTEESHDMNASSFLKIVDTELNTDCCICFERKPELMLPCMHSFCQPCISSWNVGHQTCPICRQDVGKEEEAWVIPKVPNRLEIGEELVTSVMDIAE